MISKRIGGITMYIYKKEELDPKFYDAVLLCELMGMKWNSLYMDKSGELCISFKGKLSEEQVRTVLMHFLDIIYNDTNINSISTEYHKDYKYTGNRNREIYTSVYTPDGVDYRKYQSSYAVMQM